MSEPDPRAVAKAAVEAYSTAFSTRFKQHGIGDIAPGLGHEFKVKLREALSPLQPDPEGGAMISFILDELYFSVAEFEVCLRQALLVYDTGEVKRGSTEKFPVEEMRFPDLGEKDFLFWLHVSNSWEAMYRAISRLENLLNFCLFRVGENPSKEDAAHITKFVKRVETERPDLTKSPEFKALRALVCRRQKVSGKRNADSHWASSVWSRVRHTIRKTDILAPNGKNIWEAEVTFPDARQELETLRQRHDDFDKHWIQSVGKFLLGAAGRLKPAEKPRE